MRDAMGTPVLILLAGMVGFGAMGHSHGLDALWLGLCSVFMFALPGQIVLVEMLLAGAAWWSIAFAVVLTSARFVTMVLTLFPQLHRRNRNRGLYLWVQLLAMTAWALSMRAFPRIAPRHRLSYFIGLGLPCWLVALPGTLLGYSIAGWVPTALNLGLVFINPLFFLLTFVDVRPLSNRMAIVLGGCLGPLFYLLDPDTSLLLSGLCAGTLAYGLDRYQRGLPWGPKA
jgi:predicted branched-subunit amino acid permease